MTVKKPRKIKWMPSGKITAGNIIVNALLFTLFSIGSYCRDASRAKMNPGLDTRDSLFQAERLRNYSGVVFPSIAIRVKTGDLVTRCGRDLSSRLFRAVQTKDQSFSHIGIASIENDTVFVYHSIGGELNPNQKMKREPLWFFLHPLNSEKAGLFQFPLNEMQQNRLTIIVRDLYKKEIPFDTEFDWQSNNRLYCAEMVVKCYRQALENNNFFTLSKIMDKDIAAVDDITTNAQCKAVGKWSY